MQANHKKKYAVLLVESSVPELLERLRGGNQSVMNELVSVLYGELRRIAARQLRGERAGHTLETTALVHEAYLKLYENGSRDFSDRVHFLTVASRVMRQVLVDYGRARATKKRGGEQPGYRRRGLRTTTLAGDPDTALDPVDVLDLDRALEALALEDSSLAQSIELRYFGGMTAEEIAEAVGKSVHVVRHDLRFAQAWLRRKLNAHPGADAAG
ncbi:MAG TPA: ECF-type sigma factor [Bryobacteraceae bacterium]|nr:ECF-type sigma factor [Bryobacteraceae bacterium]